MPTSAPNHYGRDHQRQQHVQQVKPGAARGEQRSVEDHLEQQRGDHSQAAGHHDETGNDPQFPPVRAEQPAYPAQQLAVAQR